jgi:hypothetical protein
MTTVLPPAGDYSTILSNYAPPGSDGIDLWKQFLIANSLPTNLPPPQNAATEGAFVDYLKSLYNVDPPTGIYDTLLSSFTGSYSEKMTMWTKFLISNGLALDSPPPINSTLFVSLTQFLQGIASFSTASLSPDELAKRKVMLDTFDIILKMLNALQNTIGVQANTLYFYGKWQQEYTKMLTRVPVYTANPTESMQVDVNDLTKFTFGYAGISVSDIAGHMASKVAVLLAGEGAFTIRTPVTRVSIPWTASGNSYPTTPASFDVQISYKFTPSFDTTTQKAVITVDTGLEISNSAGNNPENGPKQLTTRTLYSDPTGISSQAGQASTLQPYYAQLVSQAITNNSYSYNYFDPNATPGGIKDFNLTASYNPTSKKMELRLDYQRFDTVMYNGTATIDAGLSIPWRYKDPNPGTGLNSDQLQANSNAAGKRGEINSQLQQYIENIRSKRQVIQDTAKQMETNLSGSKEAISQQSDLLTSIIESMKGLISAIFR